MIFEESLYLNPLCCCSKRACYQLSHLSLLDLKIYLQYYVVLKIFIWKSSQQTERRFEQMALLPVSRQEIITWKIEGNAAKPNMMTCAFAYCLRAFLYK
jgi:hypothetical protein